MAFLMNSVRSGLFCRSSENLTYLIKGRAHIAINLIGKLIAIVEASAERLYLIALTGQTDDVFSAVVLEVEHEMLRFIIVCHTHRNVSFACKVTKTFYSDKEISTFV